MSSSAASAQLSTPTAQQGKGNCWQTELKNVEKAEIWRQNDPLGCESCPGMAVCLSGRAVQQQRGAGTGQGGGGAAAEQPQSIHSKAQPMDTKSSPQTCSTALGLCRAEIPNLIMILCTFISCTLQPGSASAGATEGPLRRKQVEMQPLYLYTQSILIFKLYFFKHTLKFCLDFVPINPPASDFLLFFSHLQNPPKRLLGVIEELCWLVSQLLSL